MKSLEQYQKTLRQLRKIEQDFWKCWSMHKAYKIWKYIVECKRYNFNYWPSIKLLLNGYHITSNVENKTRQPIFAEIIH